MNCTLLVGEKIFTISFCAWSGCGRESCHSRLVGVWREKIAGRWAIKASHIRKMNNKSAINDTIEPNEETAFQHV